MSASVDVGTGNLMVSTTDLKVPTVNGGLQPLGLAFNSLALQDGSAAKSGEAGTGWFMPYGRDTRLISNDDGSVLFMSTDSAGSIQASEWWRVHAAVDDEQDADEEQ